MVASFILLYPKFTVRALFIFGSFHTYQEIAILLIHIRHAFVVLTGQISVKLTFTSQTVMF